jgi:hypothetical protein
MSIPGPLRGLPNHFGLPCSYPGKNFFSLFSLGPPCFFFQSYWPPSGSSAGSYGPPWVPPWGPLGPSSGFLFFFFFLSSPWASASVEADSYFLTTLTSFCYLLLCQVIYPPAPRPSSCPIEGCQGGQDIGHWPLLEPMPHHPILEPLGYGASEYRSPLLLLWSIIFFLFLFSFLWGPYWAPRGPPSSRSAAGCARNLQVLPPLNAPARGCGGCFYDVSCFYWYLSRKVRIQVGANFPASPAHAYTPSLHCGP